MNVMNIFYADDDEDDIMFFEDAVKEIITSIKKSITLHSHKNGEHLLDSIKHFSISNSIVFLDLNMPKKDGFQLLKEIRSEPQINDVPIIMYSTSSADSNIEMSQKLGANFYAIKPYDFRDLKAIIENAIKINWKTQIPDFNNFIFNNVLVK